MTTYVHDGTGWRRVVRRLYNPTAGVWVSMDDASTGEPTAPPAPAGDLSPWGTPFLSTHNASPSGTGVQDTLLEAAALTAGAVNPANTRRVILAPGTYTEQVGTVASYLSIGGAEGARDETVIHWPNPTESGLIRQYPFETVRSVHLHDLTLWGEYRSYAMHADGTATPGTPMQQIYERVRFKNNFGDYAVGIGSGGATEMYFDDCIFEVTNGVGSPFFGHNVGSQSAPSLVVLRNPTWISENGVVVWSDINSDQPDLFILSGGNKSGVTGAGGDVTLSFGAGTTSVADTTIDYRIDSMYTLEGADAPSASRVIPDPLPWWTDADSQHNLHFGIHGA